MKAWFKLLYLVSCLNLKAFGYYLSPTKFESWQESSNFCEQDCKSKLVSIHNKQEYDEILIHINSSSFNYGSVWIGLNNINQNNWLWTDGTPFDYGNPIIKGQYPWSDQLTQSSTSSPKCTLLDANDHFRWNTRYITITLYNYNTI